MPRTRIEYGGCSVMNRSRPRRSATHWASTIRSAGIGGASEGADLAGVDEIAERPEGLVDVGGLIRPVDLVEIDVVGAEAAEAVLALGDDPPARAALGVGVVAHRCEDLGGQHDPRPVDAGQRLAHDDLGLPAE